MTRHAARLHLGAAMVAAGITASASAATSSASAGADTLAIVGELPITGGQTLVLSGDCVTAAVGTADGIVFVDWTDPAAPADSATVALPASDRRVVIPCEVGYFSASSTGGGLDRLVGCTTPALVDTLPDGLLESATDLACDPFGFLYAATPEGLRAFAVFDPSDPVEQDPPVFAEAAITRLVQTGARALGLAAGGIAVIDVATGSDRLRLNGWCTYPSMAPVAVHLNADRTAFVVDGGTDPARLMVLDATSTEDWSIIQARVGPPGATALDVSVVGSLAFVSWGAAGVEVLDVSDPAHPERVSSVALRDGLPVVALEAAVTPAGRHVVLLDAMGLRIAEVGPLRVSVSGVVRSDSGEPVPDALVQVAGSERMATTNPNGVYAISVSPGAFAFDVAAFGHRSRHVESSALDDVVLDITLERRPTGSFHGSIELGALAPAMPAMAGERIGGASRAPDGTYVRLLGTGVSVPSFVSYAIEDVPARVWVVEVDRFGWTPVQFEIAVEAGQDMRRDVTLPGAAFFDSFESDRGWTVGSPGDDATAGVWERAAPVGSGAGDVQSDRDDTPGPFVNAFITGNGTEGDWLDAADVDGGQTTLTSPVLDLSGVVDPIFRYYRWLELEASAAGESPDGDALIVSVSSDGGATWSEIETRSEGDRTWTQINYELWRYADVTSTMQVRFVVADRGAPSIVEAGIDDVEVFSGADLLVPIDYTPIDGDPPDVAPIEPPSVPRLGPVAPNPFGARAVIPFTVPEGAGAARLTVYDVAGRRVAVLVDRALPGGASVLSWDGRDHAGRAVAPGRYVLELRVGRASSRRSIVILR